MSDRYYVIERMFDTGGVTKDMIRYLSTGRVMWDEVVAKHLRLVKMKRSLSLKNTVTAFATIMLSIRLTQPTTSIYLHLTMC